MSVSKFERFFRCGLDVDKTDLKRYGEFANRKVYHFLVRGEAIAKANGSQIIEPFDLPITKGLQENIRAFEQVDEDIALAPILAHLTALPRLSLICSDETEAQLPSIAGGLSIALAHTLKIIDPKLRNPQTEHWQRSFRIFDLSV